MVSGNRYDQNKHDSFIKCPRCGNRNAPQKSSEFRPDCWDCGVNLGVQPVSPGDEVTVEIVDIHENGAGLGYTEEHGFAVFVEGHFPEKRLRVSIGKVQRRSAWADEIIEELEFKSTDENETEEDEEDPSLGSRRNFWG